MNILKRRKCVDQGGDMHKHKLAQNIFETLAREWGEETVIAELFFFCKQTGCLRACGAQRNLSLPSGNAGMARWLRKLGVGMPNSLGAHSHGRPSRAGVGSKVCRVGSNCSVKFTAKKGISQRGNPFLLFYKKIKNGIIKTSG